MSHIYNLTTTPQLLTSSNSSEEVQEIKYPSFGQPIGNPYKQNFKQIAKRVAIIGLVILGVAAVNIYAGAALLLSLIVCKVAKEIYVHFNRHRYRLAFDPTSNNKNAPKLGEFSKVDIRVSNHVTESFEWKKLLIASAKNSIELSPNFAGGENFQEILELIEYQMTRFPDLKCHILLSHDCLIESNYNYLKRLKEFYPNFHYFITDRIQILTPEYSTEENHVKMLIVDGKYFVMGGSSIHQNLTREEALKNEKERNFLLSLAMDNCCRDTDIIGYGEVTQTMRNQFFNLYRIWENRMTNQDVNRYFPSDFQQGEKCELFHDNEGLIKNVNLKYLVSGPEHREKNPISSEMAHLISKSKKEIRIANFLFQPDKTISNALKKAKKSKVKITGYFIGCGINFAPVRYLLTLMCRSNYHLVNDAYEYKKKNQYYHKKIVTSDSQYTVIGSFNFGIKSSVYDYENVCVIDDQRVCKLINEALDEDARWSDHLANRKLDFTQMFSILPSLVATEICGNFFG